MDSLNRLGYDIEIKVKRTRKAVETLRPRLEALSLPLRERAELTEQLLSSLDSLSQAAIEKLWFQEAARRQGKAWPNGSPVSTRTSDALPDDFLADRKSSPPQARDWP